jgi:hypothetical protein
MLSMLKPEPSTGFPSTGHRPREDKPITELETRVLLADGTVVLEGTAACYTMPLG